MVEVYYEIDVNGMEIDKVIVIINVRNVCKRIIYQLNVDMVQIGNYKVESVVVNFLRMVSIFFWQLIR